MPEIRAASAIRGGKAENIPFSLSYSAIALKDVPMNADLLHILACPQCRNPFLPENNGFFCPACDLVYPIIDGIPVLLIEEAVPRSQWTSRPNPDDGAPLSSRKANPA